MKTLFYTVAMWLLIFFSTFSSSPSLFACQQEDQPEKSRPDWQRLLGEAGKQKAKFGGGPIESELATEFLIECYSDSDTPWNAKEVSQYLFFESIWLVENEQAGALDPESGERQIVKSIGEIETRLIKQGVPETVAQVGRCYLANFFYKSRMWKELAATLDDPALQNAVNSPDVIPLYHGLFLNLKGRLAESEMNFSDAMDFHVRALKSRQKLLPQFKDNFEAESYNNLGLLLLRVGDYASAKTYLEKAIRIYTDRMAGRQPHGELMARINWAKAIEYAVNPRPYDKAIEMLLKVEEKSVSMEAIKSELKLWMEVTDLCRNNLALAYYNSGKFKECDQLFTRVAKRRIESTNERDIQRPECDINLGWAKLALKQPEKAESHFRFALEQLGKFHEGSHRIPEAMSYLARALHLNNPAEARALLEQALDLREEYLFKTLSTALSDRNRLAIIQSIRVHPESVAWPGEFDTYLELAGELGVLEVERYRRVLIWKGALARMQRANEATNSDSVKPLAEQRQQLRRKILLATKSSQQLDPQLPTKLQSWESQVNKLDQEIRRLQAQDTTLPPPVSPADVVKALPAAAAFLDIIEFRKFLPREEGKELFDERHYGAFIVTKSDLHWFEFGSAETIDEDLAQFKDRAQHEQDVDSVGAELNDAFGRSLRDQLGDIKLLVVSADGRFNDFAWAALPDTMNEGKAWVDWVSVVNVPTAQSLIDRSQDRTEKVTGWVTVGNVDYGPKSQATDWDPLSKTGTEAIAIDQILSKNFPALINQPNLEGLAATKAALLKYLPEKDVVHIATHGKFFGDGTQGDAFAVSAATSPLDSLLVLAGANNDPSLGMDSLLTAEEISGLDLKNVRLLVLSACETGLGYVQAGQGLVGLTSAFDRAGVHSTVASLWKVDDEATQILMKYFYEHLLEDPENFPVAEALRLAQQRLRQHPSGKYALPYYWAPWVIVGSPGTGSSR